MTDRLPPSALRELRDLEQKATPGPWKLWGMSVMWDKGGDSDVARAQKVANTFCSNAQGSPRTFDADLIATTRNALPALLAAAERLAELESALNFLHRECPCSTSDYEPGAMLVLAKQFGWTPASVNGGGGRAERLRHERRGLFPSGTE